MSAIWVDDVKFSNNQLKICGGRKEIVPHDCIYISWPRKPSPGPCHFYIVLYKLHETVSNIL